MQTHQLSTLNHIFPQPSLSPCHIFYWPSSPIQSSTKLAFNQEPKSGFCDSLKRVSKSLTRMRKCNGGDRIRCIRVQGDGFYMRRCVELARKAIGCTRPNPMVGCVIVKNGKIVGEGFHPKAGQPQAEVKPHSFVLVGEVDAGELAEGATVYVSLEPCNHYGRTPPCIEALIKAKVKKVVVGMVDPNPIVDSKGLERLRDAGIDVTVGIEEELCERLNGAFIHRIVTGKPFVTLRYSLSVNGHLLDQLGEGVTESGGYYSLLLQEHDAIILPATLIAKYSIPTSQEPGASQPFQIITASNPTSPIRIPGLSVQSSSKVLLFTGRETAVETEMREKGIETVTLHQMNLNAILDYYYSRGICSVLVDLRGDNGDLEMLLKEGIDQNLLRKIVVEVLPVWKESDGRNPRALLNSLGKGLKVKNLQPKISSHSTVLEGYL